MGHITLSDAGEELRLYYPTTNSTNNTYISDSILVEFGGRNVTEPGAPHHITPILAERIPELEFPKAYVMVLAPERTFWEKATLIHVECHRQRQLGIERISRHWYDLVMLSRGTIGKNALSQRNLLEEVVRHKTAFFNASYAHYHLCLNKSLTLMPQEPLLSNLRKDYAAHEYGQVCLIARHPLSIPCSTRFSCFKNKSMDRSHFKTSCFNTRLLCVHPKKTMPYHAARICCPSRRAISIMALDVSSLH